MTAAARARLRLRLPLLAVSATAWIVLVFEPVGMAWPRLCTDPWSWTASSGIPLDLALALNRPASLAGGWALMLAAMMTPLVLAPVRHVHDRSFARRRIRSVVLFAAGYAACWLLAGIGLSAVALVLRSAVPGAVPPLLLALLAALAWQVSPAKQRCLNRCHATAPLAAFGPAADRDAAWFGLSHGAWCVGACWALMLVPLLAPHGHVVAMGLVTLWLCFERLEPPARLRWGWRGPGRAVRALHTWIDVHLGGTARRSR